MGTEDDEDAAAAWAVFDSGKKRKTRAPGFANAPIRSHGAIRIWAKGQGYEMPSVANVRDASTIRSAEIQVTVSSS